jgi:hypothetical protein
MELLDLSPAALARWVRTHATVCTRLDGAPALLVGLDDGPEAVPLGTRAARAWVACAVAQETGAVPPRRAVRDALRLLALEVQLPRRGWVFHSDRDRAQLVALVRMLRRVVASGRSWEGTAAELARALGPPPVPRAWYQTPSALGRVLRRRAPVLAVHGLDVRFARQGHGRDRVLTIRPTRPHEPLPD